MIALIAAAAVSVPVYGLVKVDGHWFFRTPEGTPMWSLGPTCTDLGEAKVDPKNPGFSAMAVYGSEEKWAAAINANLKDWGFNSVGGWSAGQKLAFPYFTVLHLGAYNRAPYGDLFSKETEEYLDKAAKDQIVPILNDPRNVGYFSDNELGWWRESLFAYYRDLAPDSAGRKAWEASIRRYYKNDFSRVKREWTGTGESFADLGRNMRLIPGAGGMRCVTAFQTDLTTFYYKLVQRLIRKYDPKRMVMGDRYCQFYYPNVAKSSAKFIDVASTNLGADWNNGEVSHFFLDTLHRATQKPVVITEFYMAAMENRSGNKNSSGGFPVVQTQKERASAVKKYLAELSSRPFVIGAHWFQYYDEPTFGRKDGENYNMGLVDIYGKPYDELIDVFRSFKPSKPTPRLGTIAKAPLDALTSLRNWDKRSIVVPHEKDLAFGDLYLAKDAGHLYVGLYAMDFVDESLYADGKIPEVDRPHLQLKLNGKSISVRFGGKNRPATVTGKAEVKAIDGIRHSVMLKISAPTGKVTISGTLSSHGGAYRMRWPNQVHLDK
jgi:hypothetical protein